MAQSIQIKNMLEAVTSKLIDIVGSILSEKRVKKILKHIQLQENQEALTIVMQNTMPKAKIIRSNVKTGGKRRKKDPAAPKRNLTSYILFCQDKRTEVKDSNPNLKGVDITKKLGLLWNESSEKVKAKYTKRAVKDKTRYTEEMKDYTPSAEWLVESDSDTGSKTKTNKPRTGPKKVSSAYIFFCKDMRDNIKDNNPDMDSKDVTRELGRLWKDEYKDNAKKSAIWFTKADEDKERFAYDKSKWVDNEANEDSDKYAPEATKTVENESEPDTKSEPETKKSKSKSKKVENESEPETKSDSETKKSKSKSKSKSSTKSKKIETDSDSDSETKAKTSLIVPTGFANFASQNRKDMRNENPKWNMSQVTKELERLWSTMETDERSHF